MNLKTLQDKELCIIQENNIRGGISSVMGYRYLKSDENKTIIYKDASNIYVWAMSLCLPYDEIKLDESVKLEHKLNTSDVFDIGYSIEVDLKYLDALKQRTRILPFFPEKNS